MAKSVVEIIENLYNSADLNNCINKFIRPDCRDDFKHDLIIYLHDNYADKIVQLDERNELKYYVARIIINASKSNNSALLKIYQNSESLPDNMELKDTFDINERLLFEQKEDRLIEEIDNLDNVFNSPFYKAVVKALTKHNSMRELSRETDIPATTLSRTVKKVREHLKNIK